MYHICVLGNLRPCLGASRSGDDGTVSASIAFGVTQPPPTALSYPSICAEYLVGAAVEGRSVGANVGASDGDGVGSSVGTEVGSVVGTSVGVTVC